MNRALFSIGGALAAAFAPLAAARAADDALAQVRRRGVLRFGVKTDLPSIGYVDPAKRGDPEGFEIDFARAIARGVVGDPGRARFTPVTTADRIPKLLADEIDLILATMTITQERLQQIDFSEVYFDSGQALLVQAGSKIGSYRDLGGKSVCTATGSTSEGGIRRNAPAARVVLKPTYGDCYQALTSGAVDAMTTDKLILLGFADQDPKRTKFLAETFTNEPYGIGIKKGADSLRAAVNAALEAAKADGSYAGTYEKWLHEPLPRNYGYWLGMDPARAAALFAQQR